MDLAIMTSRGFVLIVFKLRYTPRIADGHEKVY